MALTIVIWTAVGIARATRGSLFFFNTFVGFCPSRFRTAVRQARYVVRQPNTTVFSTFGFSFKRTSQAAAIKYRGHVYSALPPPFVGLVLAARSKRIRKWRGHKTRDRPMVVRDIFERVGRRLINPSPGIRKNRWSMAREIHVRRNTADRARCTRGWWRVEPLKFRTTTRGLRGPQNRIISVCLARTVNCFFRVVPDRTIRSVFYYALLLLCRSTRSRYMRILLDSGRRNNNNNIRRGFK